MITEQAKAFAGLRALAAPARLWVRPDAGCWPVITRRLRQIEWYCHGQGLLWLPAAGGGYTRSLLGSPRLFSQL